MHECTLPLIWAVETITTCNHRSPISSRRLLQLFFWRMTKRASGISALAAILAVAEARVAVTHLAMKIIALLWVGTCLVQVSTGFTIAACASHVEGTQICITQRLRHLTKLKGRHFQCQVDIRWK